MTDGGPLVGMVVPPAGDMVPPEAAQLYPTGIRFVARSLGISAVDVASFDLALERLAEVVAELAELGANGISLMGTSLSFYGGWAGNEQLRTAIATAAGGPPVTTMANAVVRHLRRVGARRVAVGSAYAQELSDRLLRFLADADFEVVGHRHLQLKDVDAIQSVGTDELVTLGAGLLESAERPDALLLSCGGLRTLEATEMLHQRFGTPVISSAVAGVHDAVAMVL